MKQSQLLTRCMGGVFPELGDELANMHSILDLACGRGGWVLDAAYAYPTVEVVGIDIDASLVQYARAHARVQGLENATFQHMDISRPLAFPDHSIDLINARFLFSVLSKNAWTPLVAECLRILRPGGVLRLTEMEKPISETPWQKCTGVLVFLPRFLTAFEAIRLLCGSPRLLSRWTLALIQIWASEANASSVVHYRVPRLGRRSSLSRPPPASGRCRVTRLRERRA
jgi:SAM-dependent methyltransferase